MGPDLVLDGSFASTPLGARPRVTNGSVTRRVHLQRHDPNSYARPLHRTNTPVLQTGLSGHNDTLVIKQAIDLEKLPRDPSWGPREEPLVKQNSLLEESRNNRNVIYISV